MDANIRWSDAFLLGFDPMDETHREFVAIVSELLVAPDRELARVMADMERHAEAHFAQESRWMEETRFPAMECHNNEHAAVLASIRGVRSRVTSGEKEIARRLAHELAAWFPAHADYLDSALAQWMVKHQFGGAPVVFKRSVVRETS